MGIFGFDKADFSHALCPEETFILMDLGANLALPQLPNQVLATTPQVIIFLYCRLVTTLHYQLIAE